MSLINIGLIFVAGLDLGIALLIWLRNPKNKINISLPVGIVFLAIWTFGSAMMREATSVSSALFWGKILNIGGIVLIVPFWLFSEYFPYQIKKLSKIKISLAFLMMVIILIVLYIPNLYLLESGIVLNPSSNNYHFNHGYKLFVAYFLFFMFLAYYNFFTKYKNSQGFLRTQLYYIIVGTGVVSLFGTIFGAITPLFYEGRYFWIGPYFALPMIVILTYFVFKNSGR